MDAVYALKMRSLNHSVARHKPGPLLVLFILFVCALWIAGGASRANVSGQLFVRAVAWLCLIVMILFKSGWSIERGRPVIFLLGTAVALAIAQLVPLPPGIWLALSGRAMFADATAIAGEPMPWRPLAIYPSGAINALGSLIVPCVALCFVVGRVRLRDSSTLKVVLGLVVAVMLVGLLQFAGVAVRSPLVNGNIDVSGTLANRNHFALLMASGLLLASAWAVAEPAAVKWRGPVAIGLSLILVLAILGSGSRAGMVVGVVGLGCALLMVRSEIGRALARFPRRIVVTLSAGAALTLAVVIAISIRADRAVSINRAFAVDPAQDMRSLGLPTVIIMVRDYLAAGSGLGGFDAVFRIHEPFALLKPTYFNRAHNDFLEIALDAGIAGIVLLLSGLAWWLWMSIRAWRAGPGREKMLPKLGSALLLIILLASIVDYPARTPMIMFLAVIAGVWLGEAGRADTASALPARGRNL